MMFTPLLLVLSIVPVDFSAYRENGSLAATREGDRLTVAWPGAGGQALRLQLNLADPARLVGELSVAGRALLRDAAPAYSVYTGKRRGGWDNFFDTPAQRPHDLVVTLLDHEVCGRHARARALFLPGDHHKTRPDGRQRHAKAGAARPRAFAIIVATGP